MKICDLYLEDGLVGVRWEELQSCVKKYKNALDRDEYLIPHGITKRDFFKMDYNNDDIVTKAEWKKFCRNSKNTCRNFRQI